MLQGARSRQVGCKGGKALLTWVPWALRFFSRAFSRWLPRAMFREAVKVMGIRVFRTERALGGRLIKRVVRRG